jgi:hypothetical protein
VKIRFFAAQLRRLSSPDIILLDDCPAGAAG